MSCAEGSNVASSGSLSVTVVGRGGLGASGTSSRVQVGATACSENVWRSDSEVECRSALLEAKDALIRRLQIELQRRESYSAT